MNIRKLVSFKCNNKLQWGILDGDEVYSAENLSHAISVHLPENLLDFISLGPNGLNRLKAKLKKEHCVIKSLNIDAITITAPIMNLRRNIFCIGENYVEHVGEFEKNFNMEIQKKLPSCPVIFTKAASAIIGPEELIDSHPMITKALDYEGELAVVIGKKGMNISAENAMEYVYGYTILNDVSARDLQSKHGQWFHGKSLNTFAPMGPCILLKDEAPSFFEIMTKVNGEIRQHATTKEFIFSISKIIQTLSEGTTLYAGDVIATGTPSGVGVGFTPPKYLRSGDLVEITISDIGTLSNSVK